MPFSQIRSHHSSGWVHFSGVTAGPPAVSLSGQQSVHCICGGLNIRTLISPRRENSQRGKKKTEAGTTHNSPLHRILPGTTPSRLCCRRRSYVRNQLTASSMIPLDTRQSHSYHKVNRPLNVYDRIACLDQRT